MFILDEPYTEMYVVNIINSCTGEYEQDGLEWDVFKRYVCSKANQVAQGNGEETVKLKSKRNMDDNNNEDDSY